MNATGTFVRKGLCSDMVRRGQKKCPLNRVTQRTIWARMETPAVWIEDCGDSR